jgi:predicted Zn-dependent protease
MHPELDFEIRFPKGWYTQNSGRMVGAVAPRGEAMVYLTADMPLGDLVELADGFVVTAKRDFGVKVTEKKKVRIGTIPAVRYGFEGGGVLARVTFFPFADMTWRIVGAAPAYASQRYLGQILLTGRSFGPITDKSRLQIRIKRLDVVLARPGEDVIRLGKRTGNAWSATDTALMNGLLGNDVFEGGELMKILRIEGI